MLTLARSSISLVDKSQPLHLHRHLEKDLFSFSSSTLKKANEPEEPQDLAKTETQVSHIEGGSVRVPTCLAGAREEWVAPEGTSRGPTLLPRPAGGRGGAHGVGGQWQNCSQRSPAQKSSLAGWYLPPMERPPWTGAGGGGMQSVLLEHEARITLPALPAWCQVAVGQGRPSARAGTREEPPSSSWMVGWQARSGRTQMGANN